MLTRRGWWQLLCKRSQHYCTIDKTGPPVTMAILMIIVLTASTTILQFRLATTTDFPSSNNTTITTIPEYDSSLTLVPSNRSVTNTLLDKTTNVTLKGIFDDLGVPGAWKDLLQPALDELNRRHPDMNIQIEYDEFPYPRTRN